MTRVGMGKRVDIQERPHHHGDLRCAIVRAAPEILSETQSVDFSLRELARRAGVSHNAPYKHFAEKPELLEAVSTAGFELSNEIAKHSNARAQLFAVLRAYIHHGVENPAKASRFAGWLGWVLSAAFGKEEDHPTEKVSEPWTYQLSRPSRVSQERP